MSGIAGILKTPSSAVSEEELIRLADAIAHRGPDGRATFIDANLGLAHCYLRIPSAVSTPHPVYNEDRSLAAVCDGRVYNHAELRRRLEAKGHRFSTASDVEVLLHLYEEKGNRFLDDVNGMYGLALWDGRRRRLLLARDRIGVKPLYYAQAASGLLFGSEIKAILADASVKRRVNFRAMSDFFGLSYIFDGETMFEDIMAVPPGCIYSVEAGRPGRLSRYWEMEFDPDRPWNEPELMERGLAVLEEAVALEIADVDQVGIHLSGGIDSSFITSLAARNDRDRIIALSAGFREKSYDERDYARLAAEQAGVEHREVEVFPEETTFLDTMEKVIWHVDEPTVSPGIHSFYVLNEFTARHVKVVLGGQGSNELLAGYNRYVLAETRDVFARHLKRLNLPGMVGDIRATAGFFGPRPLKGMLLEASRSPGQRALKIASTFAPREKLELFSDAVRAHLNGYTTERRYLSGFESAPASTTMDRMMYLDMKNMMPNMCRILDRTSAAFGVEARTPYLDHNFVEFAASLPDDAVLKGTESKYILKKMGEGILNHGTIYRDKSGFAAPVTPWLQGHLRREARDIIFSRRALGRGYFDEGSMRTLVDRHEKTGRGVWQVWMLLIFELWHRKFIDGD
ncbi:MAG: asparagine synthase (glutamine-hydrolyzing) [Thermoleophilia bacterium]|nr:asparagine synthase (glutamine-hydrolyzing) [Thermoleophilia bacterium]